MYKNVMIQKIIYLFNIFFCQGINFPYFEFVTDIQYEKTPTGHKDLSSVLFPQCFGVQISNTELVSENLW